MRNSCCALERHGDAHNQKQLLYTEETCSSPGFWNWVMQIRYGVVSQDIVHAGEVGKG
jgi:hypothetical protein